MGRPIYADSLKEEINLLRVTITGGRLNGKAFFREIMEEYKNSVLRIIDEQPTADIAPKSEVEKIFEEVEKAVEDAEFEWGTFYGVKLAIAELKKKYTEVK